MAFGMQDLHRPAIEIEPGLVICDHHARLVDGHDIAVHLARALFTVDTDRSGDKPLGAHHMWGAPRMHDAARVWQVLHEQAGAAGMVKVYMRQENKVDVADIKVLLA